MHASAATCKCASSAAMQLHRVAGLPSKHLKLCTSPLVSTASCSLRIRGHRVKADVVKSVANVVRRSQYSRAFQQLLSTGAAARRVFNAAVQRSTAQELRRYTGSQHHSTISGTESVTSFSWSDVLDDFRRSMPTL